MEIRLADPTQDYERIAQLISPDEIEPVVADDIHQWDKNNPTGTIRQRVVAVNDQGVIVGYSVTMRPVRQPQTHRWIIWIAVDATCRRQGIGTRLYEYQRAFAMVHNACELSTVVLDNNPTSLAIAQAHGFHIYKHTFGSHLALPTFDETPFVPYLARAIGSGIRFSSLAAEGNTPSAREKLFTLNSSTAADNPGTDGAGFPNFETFEHQVLNANWFNPDGQLLAIDDDRFVGLGAVLMEGADRHAYNAFTGVVREYRGRGIAQALKLLTIRYALAHGSKRLSTDNDSQNTSMLTINRKFGFVPRTGEYTLLKTDV